MKNTSVLKVIKQGGSHLLGHGGSAKLQGICNFEEGARGVMQFHF